MKVVCVNNSVLTNTFGFSQPAPQLKEGNTYTVIRVTILGGYILAEVNPLPGFDCFNPERFVPISDIDETTFERNYKKQSI